MQILDPNAISKVISTLRASVETMLRVLTAGADADGEEGNNASFAEMGTAIDAVVGGGMYSIVKLQGDAYGRITLFGWLLFEVAF